MKIPDQFAAKVLDGLRPREREILGLLYFDQFEIQDIAHLLNLKPDSVSGHLSKGVTTVGSLIEGDASDARGLLEVMGETFARRKPKQILRVVHGSEVASVGVLPHREIMGSAVREERSSTDITRYFVVEIDGKPVTTATAESWVRESAAAIDLAVRRGVLAAKGIKQPEKFDEEASSYFWPAGFGCAELYFERDFNHRPLVLPLPPGASVMDHLPPAPIEIARRPNLLPRRWPLRVMDLGEYQKDYDEAMSGDATAGLEDWEARRRPS